MICYCYLPDKTSIFSDIVTIPGKTWELTKGGWKNWFSNEGRINSCYGFDIDEVTKQDFLESIDYLFSKNWFFDFVKKEKVLCTAESK